MALQILLSAFGSIFLLLLYMAAGNLLLRLIRFESDSLLENILIKTGLGFGLTGNLIMILNFLNLSSRTGILLLIGITSLISIPQFITSIFQKKSLLPSVNLKSMPAAFFVLLFLFTLYLMRSFLPPSGFDALMYHLSSAQLYLDNSGFFNIFFNPQSDFPMLTEMNYMTGLAVSNDLICRQIDLMLGMMACGAIMLNSQSCNLSRKEMITGSVIFLTMTVVIASMTGCDVDLALATWIAISAYMFRKAVKKGSNDAFLICAIFAGMAMETKIFGVFVIPVLFAASLYCKEYNWKRLMWVLAIPMLMATPWYLKSFINNGTILSINSGLIVDQGLGKPMGLEISNPLINAFVNSIFRILVSLWTFSVFPSQHQQDMLGPLFLMVLPFVFFIKLNSETRYLLSIAGIYMLVILFMEILFIPGGSSIRYLLVVPLFLIPVCLYTLKSLKIMYPGIHRILSLLLITQIALGTLLLIKRYNKDWIALLTHKSRDDYYQSIMPQYGAIKFINDLQDSKTVMTIYNYDNYLIKKPYICTYRHYQSKNDLQEDINKHSISHIFANDVFDTLSNSSAFPQLDNKHIVYAGKGFYVYEVSEPAQ